MPKASRSEGALIRNPKVGLFDQFREVMRFHHYALRTEEAYLLWIRRYLKFHRGADQTGPQRGWRHPKEMGPAQVREFLTHLALSADVAASTQNQALNALVFLYDQVLQSPLGDLGEVARVTRPARLPAVLTQEETRRVLAALKPGSAGQAEAGTPTAPGTSETAA
jgi:site-specific recombinase XerD